MGFDTMNSLEVQALLKISRSTLEAWLKAGKLKGYKVGRRWLFKRSEVEALINDHPRVDAGDQMKLLEECRQLQKEILKSLLAREFYLKNLSVKPGDHGRRVLDLGCGIGALTAFLSELFSGNDVVE